MKLPPMMPGQASRFRSLYMNDAAFHYAFKVARVVAETGSAATYADGRALDQWLAMVEALKIRDIDKIREEIMCDGKETAPVFGDPMGWDRVREAERKPVRAFGESSFRIPKTLTREPAPLYVAVVTKGRYSNGNVIPSAGRPAGSSGGDFASFVDIDRTKVIEQALEAARKWQKTASFAVKYVVWVGELTDLAQEKPVQFETIDLKTGLRTGGTVKDFRF